MDLLAKLNSLPMFLIVGVVVAFIAALCVVFLVRSWRAGVALGMDKARLRRAITSSATFTLLPSVSILLGVIALSGSLGIPLPWIRLSVIGALHYEGNVADIAARAAGMSGGVAYVWDPDRKFDYFCNMEMVELSLIEEAGYRKELHELIRQHYLYTGSKLARTMLDDWNHYVDQFIQIVPIEYKKVLQEEQMRKLQQKIADMQRDY